MTFVFIYTRVIQRMHSYITKIHTNIITSFSFVSTFASWTFKNLVLPFRWLERELIGMFRDLLALFNEHVFHPMLHLSICLFWLLKGTYWLVVVGFVYLMDTHFPCPMFIGVACHLWWKYRSLTSFPTLNRCLLLLCRQWVWISMCMINMNYLKFASF